MSFLGLSRQPWRKLAALIISHQNTSNVFEHVLQILPICVAIKNRILHTLVFFYLWRRLWLSDATSCTVEVEKSNTYPHSLELMNNFGDRRKGLAYKMLMHRNTPTSMGAITWCLFCLSKPEHACLHPFSAQRWDGAKKLGLIGHLARQKTLLEKIASTRTADSAQVPVLLIKMSVSSWTPEPGPLPWVSSSS